MQGDSVLIDLGTGLRIIDHFRQHALWNSFGAFDGSLTRSRSVDREIADAEGQNRSKTLGQIFFAAVEAIHRNHQRHWTFCVLWQSQVADDLLAFEWNVHHFERRIVKLGVREESLRSPFHCERYSLPGEAGIGQRPKGIDVARPECSPRSPWSDRNSLEGLGFIKVAIGDADKACRPLILVRSIDGFEGCLDIAGIEADQRILPDLGAVNSFRLDFI